MPSNPQLTNTSNQSLTSLIDLAAIEVCSSKQSFELTDASLSETPTSAPDDDFNALVNEVAAMKDRLSERYTFKKWFAPRVDRIRQLRSQFPEPGSHEKTKVHVNGYDPEEVTWDDFVKKYLDITPQYLNGLIRSAVKEQQVTKPVAQCVEKSRKKAGDSNGQRPGNLEPLLTQADAGEQADRRDMSALIKILLPPMKNYFASILKRDRGNFLTEFQLCLQILANRVIDDLDGFSIEVKFNNFSKDFAPQSGTAPQSVEVA